MPNQETNYIQFEDNNILQACGVGKISTLDHDIEIKVVPFTSDNENAPTHQVFGSSPAGHPIPIGGIWQKKNKDGGDYLTLSLKEFEFNANLGRKPKQEDDRLQAIIRWDHNRQE